MRRPVSYTQVSVGSGRQWNEICALIGSAREAQARHATRTIDAMTDEFQTVDLGDQRLNDRCRLLAQRLAANPQASINAASQGWNETHAAYQFFDNQQVDPDDILAAHQDATRRRIDQYDTVLLVQDTTELDFSKHPTKDAGVLNEDYRFGLVDHSQIAFTETGLCLGAMDVELFSHDPQTKYPNKQIINVADREAVFGEFEWKPVWKVVRSEPLPEQPPSLGEMILMIGELGGHNNRRCDAPPGAEAMWNGLRRMKDFSLA